MEVRALLVVDYPYARLVIIDTRLLPANVSAADVEFVATRRAGLVKANPGHRRVIRGHDESGRRLELDLWENCGVLTLVSATLAKS